MGDEFGEFGRLFGGKKIEKLDKIEYFWVKIGGKQLEMSLEGLYGNEKLEKLEKMEQIETKKERNFSDEWE